MDSVPVLIRVVEDENSPAWNAAMDALARLKDERAAAPAARYLPNFIKRGPAVAVLRAVGAPAEKEVLKYLYHQDAGVRMEAANLLKGYGTKDTALFDQALADLKASDPGTRQAAAEAIGRTKLDAMRQAEVARALDPLLTDTHDPARDAALQALTVWATADNVPSLIKLLDDPNPRHKWKAMDILPRFQDERVAVALANKLNTPERLRAVNGLKTMGPVAEKVAVQCLGSPDAVVRREACTILAAVGTKASIPFLNQAAALDKGLNAAAQSAIRAINARP
jgi:HEAT repeat protein